MKHSFSHGRGGGAMKHSFKMWAIIGPKGGLHADKICVSRGECWGLLLDEWSVFHPKRPRTQKDAEAFGYRCVRVTLSWNDPRLVIAPNQ